MSYPELHINRNCFFFYLLGTVSYLSGRKDRLIFTKEEKLKINEVHKILRDLTENRYKRYWDLKEELEK